MQFSRCGSFPPESFAGKPELKTSFLYTPLHNSVITRDPGMKFVEDASIDHVGRICFLESIRKICASFSQHSAIGIDPSEIVPLLILTLLPSSFSLSVMPFSFRW